MKAKGEISMAEKRPEGPEHIVHGFDPVWDARSRVPYRVEAVDDVFKAFGPFFRHADPPSP